MIAVMNSIRIWFDVRWLMAAVAALLVVLTLTHIPQEMMPKPLSVHLLDKAEHAVAYGVLAFLFLLSFRRPPGVKAMLVILLAGAMVGALDETTQPWVNRIASWFDFAADLIGIAIACVFFLVMRLCRREKALHSVTSS